MWFQEQKYEKYLKSKNDIKRPLGPFNKELWAIWVFSKSGQILKPSTHGEKVVHQTEALEAFPSFVKITNHTKL